MVDVVDINSVSVCHDGVCVDIDSGNRTPCRKAGDLLARAMRLDDGQRDIIYVLDNAEGKRLCEDVAMAGIPWTSSTQSRGAHITVTATGIFYELSINLTGGMVKVWDINHLLRSTVRDVRKTYQAGTLIDALCEYLRHMRDRGLLGMTIGGVALRDYIGGDYVRHLRRFPQIDDTDMRTAYLGGFGLSKPGMYKDCVSLDVNSMYPHIMATERLPYGEPEQYSGAYEHDTRYPLTIETRICRLDLKPGGFPVLTAETIKAYRYGRHDRRIETTDGYVRLTLTGVDWEMMAENYRMSVYEVVGGWKFQASRGYFDDYVNTWFHVKQSSHGVERETAKLMLNSLCGKFGAYPATHGMAPVMRDGVLTWTPMDANGGGLRYVPVAAYVTAYGRRRLTNAIRKVGARCIYADTDGMILEGEAISAGFTVSDELGDWKTDYRYTALSIIGNQRYSGRCEDGSIHMIMSGMPMDTAIAPEDYHRGYHYTDAHGGEHVL